MDENNKILDVTNYQEVLEKENKTYTIKEIASNLNVSTTKINSIISKLNKVQKGFINNSTTPTESDFEKINLTLALMDDGMSIDEIMDYFKSKGKGLINRDTQEIEDLSLTDTQIIAKRMTQEVNKQLDNIMTSFKKEFGNMSKEMNEVFKEQVSEIAKITLVAMEQTKQDIDKDNKRLLDEIKSLKRDNQYMTNDNKKLLEEIRRTREENNNNIEEIKKLQIENEKFQSKEVARLRQQLKNKEELLKEQAKELKAEREKGFLSRLFNKK